MAIESPREECGVFGIFNPDEQVAESIYLGLFALQHRGQESAGISTTEHTEIFKKTGLGLIANVFEQFEMSELKGDLGIGHTRYSTTGLDSIENAQPLLVNGINGQISLGHNGNVINAKELKKSHLGHLDINYKTTTDSEVIAHMYANAVGKNWLERSNYCMRIIKGAFSLVFMTKDELIGVRDPLGIRPLCLGKMDNAWILASESSALAHVGAEFVREIENGETIVINKDGIKSSIFSSKPKNHKMCIFEQIYFSRPDSLINGQLAYESRVRMGESLAKEHPVDADIVVGVPDSAIPAAIGYAKQSGISYTEGLIRNRYVGRTFISPNQKIRELGVKAKFNVLKEVIRDKKIVLIDDSIVRGTTTSRVVELLKDSGAAEVHMRVSSPPIISPCFFGVDMASSSELIANNYKIESIRKIIGADSLGFLSMKNLLDSVKSNDNEYCRACFTGEYPIPVQLDFDKFHLEKTKEKN
ncbi:MAG: amidophosphoribosyltransferase [Dehalococcoidia bacterium]|nr:amidophosphoribosyltransferase [Dehalococcoidia bacterium]